jgi:hypothetical protein
MQSKRVRIICMLFSLAIVSLYKFCVFLKIITARVDGNDIVLEAGVEMLRRASRLSFVNVISMPFRAFTVCFFRLGVISSEE